MVQFCPKVQQPEDRRCVLYKDHAGDCLFPALSRELEGKLWKERERGLRSEMKGNGR